MESYDGQTTNKLIGGLGIGCILVAVCITGILVLGVAGLVWLGSQSPENITVSIDAPVVSQVGDNFQLEVRIKNTDSSPLELNSIDISMNLLKGVIVENTTPPYSETNQYDALGGNETFQTFYYYRTIQPGDTLVVVFYGRAVQPGDFSGQIDICIDSEFNCLTSVARTIIE